LFINLIGYQRVYYLTDTSEIEEISILGHGALDFLALLKNAPRLCQSASIPKKLYSG